MATTGERELLATRLSALRACLTASEIDGFIIPSTDEHLSEFTAPYARRLAWLTGFKGSVGVAVVLKDLAAIFVDGRYTLQARNQVPGDLWSYESLPPANVLAWIGKHAPDRARIGYDPWLHSAAWATRARLALAEPGVELVPLGDNPVDAIWCEQPSRPGTPLVAYSEELAGKASPAKRTEIAAGLKAMKAEVVVLSALDSIAWAFNVRAQDIPYTPVALAFALVRSDASGDLYVDRDVVSAEVMAHLGDGVRVADREHFVTALKSLADTTVALDPERTPSAIRDELAAAGARVIDAPDPTILPKACKTEAEIRGHMAAQRRDGVALTRFLHWFAIEAPKGTLTELSAARKLRELRERTGMLRDLSFETISAFGANAAMAHYAVTEATSLPIRPHSIYLVDSGAQYIDGTTDVTRTVAVGTPTALMRDRYTRCLKGHIALARAVFPRGTRGGQLDVLARQFLWSAGADFTHGTGHGVGAYLGVHEGPQRISHTGNCEAPLLEGMILSNEPGYYRPGEFGVRIENLMRVVRREIPQADLEMLGFDVLTLAPLDRSLIDCALLTVEEREWVDTYHRAVAAAIAPQLDDPAETNWLLRETRSLVDKR